MIEKALQYLVKTAQAAAAPKLILEEEREVHYDVRGEINTIAKAPPTARHHVRSLEDLAAAVVKFAQAGPGGFSVWHAPDRVIGLLDNADRRDEIRFQLNYAESFSALWSLVDDRPFFTQRDFIELLDVTLGVDKAVIAPFRKLDWDQQVRASGEVTQTKDRLGREVNAQVSGTADLPEDVLVLTPVYRDKGERETYGVRCLIRLRPAEQRIVLKPVPGELDTIVEAAQASIRERLQEMLPDGSAIFYGSP